MVFDPQFLWSSTNHSVWFFFVFARAFTSRRWRRPVLQTKFGPQTCWSTVRLVWGGTGTLSSSSFIFDSSSLQAGFMDLRSNIIKKKPAWRPKVGEDVMSRRWRMKIKQMKASWDEERRNWNKIWWRCSRSNQRLGFFLLLQLTVDQS